MSEEKIITVFVTIGPMCWGRGDTPAQAKRRAQKSKPGFIRVRAKYRTFKVTGDPKPFVDQLGRLVTTVEAVCEEV